MAAIHRAGRAGGSLNGLPHFGHTKASPSRTTMFSAAPAMAQNNTLPQRPNLAAMASPSPDARLVAGASILAGPDSKAA
jgi:hypothetical protein